jgi:hypothetical protein
MTMNSSDNDHRRDTLVAAASVLLTAADLAREHPALLAELRAIRDEIVGERRALEELVAEKRRLLAAAGLTLSKLEAEFGDAA